LTTILVFDHALADYDFGSAHPLRPERVLRSIALMRTHGLLGASGLQEVAPESATRADLERVHDPTYVDAVVRAAYDPSAPPHGFGLGDGDTPAFRGMHEAASLITGAAIVAMREVIAGPAERAFNIAGGLHHAHRDRAAGFCVYNDPAIGIAWALARDPSMRIAYIDIDAHHGDGVQEAFYADPRVLTVSLHESGRYLYPGTGFPEERGTRAGLGTAVNVPLPPYATDACYRLAFDGVVLPVVRAFGPDLIVSQNGADALYQDPLTSLGLTLGGYRWLVESISTLSDEVCGGRLVAHGGGGYAWETVVPRAWTLLGASLLRRRTPNDLSADAGPKLREGAEDRLLAETRATIDRVLALRRT
jgi:acetoin utilization protein AcuC